MPIPILTGPVNFHQLVVRHVFDEHDKCQFLLELVFISRYCIDSLEELDGFHGSRIKAIFFMSKKEMVPVAETAFPLR
jgi:hypothetical protein